MNPMSLLLLRLARRGLLGFSALGQVWPRRVDGAWGRRAYHESQLRPTPFWLMDGLERRRVEAGTEKPAIPGGHSAFEILHRHRGGAHWQFPEHTLESYVAGGGHGRALSSVMWPSPRKPSTGLATMPGNDLHTTTISSRCHELNANAPGPLTR